MIEGTRRPVPALLFYYLLASLASGPAFVLLFPLRVFRFRTLRYDFEAEGMTARWGLLFRREITLTYARVQDIHLTSNLVERWLGLARIEIQTASGQSGAELTIEGLRDFEQLRDELYARMRGARSGKPTAIASAHQTSANDEIAAVLLDAVTELRALRELLARKP